MKRRSWFESWFDSPYYHILYNKRDDKEAKHFLDNLIDFLHPDKESTILDLACGKGRHAIYLNKKGYTVTGIDLSERSIQHNKKYESPTLSFHVHDMRNEFRKANFDYVFNLFTSFGYFENAEDNIKTLQAIHSNLKPNGVLILDYFNTKKAIEQLVPKEVIIRGETVFDIEKTMVNGFIFKNISFTAKGNEHHFTEKVQLFSLKDFEECFHQSGFEMVNIFGDYRLRLYDEDTSDRLIMVVKKKS